MLLANCSASFIGINTQWTLQPSPHFTLRKFVVAIASLSIPMLNKYSLSTVQYA